MTKIWRYITSVFSVCKREFHLAYRDMGVMLFFLALPIAYPILYALIYNREFVREVPIVVVDDCRSATTREYARRLDASQYTEIAGYAANMQEAQRAMAQKDCYAIIHFPEDFEALIGRGESAHLPIYCDMSLLLRYKSVLMAQTDVTASMGADIQAQMMQLASMQGLTMNGGAIPTVKSTPVAMGNTSTGVASALLPGILVLILQQSLVLGICMLAAGSRERARANGGIDPMAIPASTSASITGKALCYFVIYIIPSIYILKYVPMFFSFPQNGHTLDIMIFMIPFLLSTIFMGMVIQRFIHERESVFLLFVFSSILFLFLSGLSWPRYGMSQLWTTIGGCFPSTWAINGYVAMKSNGAELWQVARPYEMLWLLSAIYFIVAWGIGQIERRIVKKAGSMAQASELQND